MTIAEIWHRLQKVQALAEPPYITKSPSAQQLERIHVEVTSLLADIERYQRAMGLR